SSGFAVLSNQARRNPRRALFSTAIGEMPPSGIQLFCAGAAIQQSAPFVREVPRSFPCHQSNKSPSLHCNKSDKHPHVILLALLTYLAEANSRGSPTLQCRRPRLLGHSHLARPPEKENLFSLSIGLARTYVFQNQYPPRFQ